VCAKLHMDELTGRRVGILVLEAAEQTEVLVVRRALEEAGAATALVTKRSAGDYDALVVLSGIGRDAIRVVRLFVEARKPVGAIGRGQELLVEADVLRGRIVTSEPALEAGIRAAGAYWLDAEVVTDRSLVTSRGPADLPLFCLRFAEEIAAAARQPSRA
jgi:protease I